MNTVNTDKNKCTATESTLIVVECVLTRNTLCDQWSGRRDNKQWMSLCVDVFNAIDKLLNLILYIDSMSEHSLLIFIESKIYGNCNQF